MMVTKRAPDTFKNQGFQYTRISRDAAATFHVAWEWEFPLHSIHKDRQLDNQQASLRRNLLVLMPFSVLPPDPANEGMRPSEPQGSSLKRFEVA